MADITLHIMKVGRWNGRAFPRDELEQIVSNFNTLAKEHQPPLKLGHNDEQESEIMRDGQPALGWVKGLILKGNDLYAQATDVPDMIVEAIQKNRYRTVSVELWYKVRYLGKQLGTVLKAVALLGADIPAVSGLTDLKDTLKGLLSINPDNSVSFDGGIQGEVFKFSIDNGKINERSTSDMEELKEALKRISELEGKFDKQSTDLEAERKARKEAEDRAIKAEADVEKFHKDAETAVETEVREKFAKSLEDMVEAGTMQPQFRDKLLSAAQYTKEGMLVPAGSLEEYTKAHAEFLKQGEEARRKEKEGDKAPGDILHEKTEAYAKEHKVDYAEAQLIVLREDKELAKNFGPTGEED